MDLSADQPRPPAPEKGQNPTEMDNKTDIQLAEDKLRQYIEDEPQGSVKSKAFCDIVDLIVIKDRMGEGLLDEDKASDTLKMMYANIHETIRQRGNELPGYTKAGFEIHNLVYSLEHASPEARDREQFSWIPNKPKEQRVADTLEGIKLTYLAKLSESPKVQESTDDSSPSTSEDKYL
jgi:hypothetical protein